MSPDRLSFPISGGTNQPDPLLKEGITWKPLVLQPNSDRLPYRSEEISSSSYHPHDYSNNHDYSNHHSDNLYSDDSLLNYSYYLNHSYLLYLNLNYLYLKLNFLNL